MHVGGFRAAGATVAALCGRDPERTRRVASEEGIPLATADVGELCEAVDVVVVASPDALHREHAQRAAAAGRHVLCEKPLTVDARDADALAALAAPVTLAVNFPYRFLGPFAALRAWLGGRGARLVEASVRNRFLGDPAALATTGDFGGLSHLIDTALWIARAEPAWVEASLPGGSPVAQCLHVGLTTGASVVLVHRPAAERVLWGRWSVSGDGWEAGVEGGYVEALGGWRVEAPWGFTGDAREAIGAPAAPSPGTREPWAEAHAEAARAFLRAVAGGERGALATFEEGARVQRVIAAARRSIEEGRRVEVPRHGGGP